jgi:integrase
MASIGKDANGAKRILFYDTDGKRKTVRIGKATQRQAEQVCLRIEQLVSSKLTGAAPDDETARWVGNLDDVLHKKLAAVGLVASRGDQQTVAGWMQQYIKSRTDLTPRTLNNLQQAAGHIEPYFKGRLLQDVTPGDGDQLRVWIQGRVGINTARRHLGRFKEFMRAAHRRRLIATNPAAELKGCSVQADDSRFFFVTKDMAAAVLEQCPNHEWRLLFALARFGGLRIPSELSELRWSDIDWHKQRMVIRSPKTKRHAGHEQRMVPIFSELLPHLADAFDAAPEGSEFVIENYRDGDTNLRTQMTRIIRKAGLEPWEKLFQNLRSTRESELVEKFPIHVVTKWLGNSPKIAVQHYLQVRDEHFDQAVKSESGAARNPARYTSELAGTGHHETNKPCEIPLDSAGFHPVSVNKYPRRDSNSRPTV